MLIYDKRYVFFKLWSEIFLLLFDVLCLYSYNVVSINDISKKIMMIEIIEIILVELVDEVLFKKIIRIN